jgi:hypothetical protein
MHEGSPWNNKTPQKARVNLSGLVPQDWEFERLEKIPPREDSAADSCG